MTDYRQISQAELDQLLEDRSPLIELVIEGLEFDPENVEELHASRVLFKNARFIESDITGGLFTDCQFVGCSFSSSQMSEVKFDHCVFFDPDLGKGTDFSFANLREASFINCNLAASKFVGADMYDVTIKDCKANGSDFGTATFTRTYGRRQQVTRANLQSTIFDDCNLSGLDLEGCNLVCSSLRYADLRSSHLIGADMSECDLAGAQLQRANFERADLRGAKLEGFSIGSLSGYDGMKISKDEQQTILVGLGIHVYP